MIDQFNKLGLTIEKRLIETKVDFPLICEQALSSFQLDLSLNEFEDQISSILTSNSLVKQLNVHNSFGQPPLTVFHNNQFVIDLYFWLHHDTSIHDHSFEGAFKVLYGSSLQEEFKVSILDNYTHDVAMTNLEKSKTELLYQNDIIKISRGEGFTHRLIHLESPTITLCIRTINDESKKQWHHFSNGLSIQKRIIDEKVLKSFYYCEYLFNRKNLTFQTCLDDFVKSLDISIIMNLYEQMTTNSLVFSQEFLEEFHATLAHSYANQEWFVKYQAFYESLEESYIEFNSDSPITRLIEHSYNTKIPKDQTIDLIKAYNAFEPTEQEIQLIQTIL